MDRFFRKELVLVQIQKIKRSIPDWCSSAGREVWRNQRNNQRPYIEGQRIQWPNIVRRQNGKQRSTKQYTANDWARGTKKKTEGELRCSKEVSSSCSTSNTRRFTLIKNPMRKEEGKIFETFIWVVTDYQ